MGLYHYTIGLPKGYSSPKGTYKLQYGRHARLAALTDKYVSKIVLPKTICCADMRTIEVETDSNGKFIKVLLQGKYDEKHNIAFALIPQPGGKWFVKTVWCQSNTDNHGTLRKEVYDIP